MEILLQEFNELNFARRKCMLIFEVHSSRLKSAQSIQFNIEKYQQPNFGLNDPVGFDEYLGTSSNEFSICHRISILEVKALTHYLFRI